MTANFELPRSTSSARTAVDDDGRASGDCERLGDAYRGMSSAYGVEAAGGERCLPVAGESKYVAAPAGGRLVPQAAASRAPANDDAVAAAPDLLTVAQVMARLQVGRHTVYDLIRSRRLRSVLIGRCRRIPVTALREFLDSLTGKE